MIVLFGAIGSGKTEQGERLVKHLDCPRVSTSQLLRQAADPRHLQQIAEGTLVSDQDILDLLGPELKKVDADKNEFILDGSPRSIPQAKWLISKIEAGEVKFTAIIYLKVPVRTVVERLVKRGRLDDKEDIIRRRLDEYAKITTPVLDYLGQEGYKVDEINGSPPSDQVEKSIQAVLETKNAG
jgi:adenylate kinase